MNKIHIVFSGEGPDCQFVECENERGESISAGTWHKREDGYHELIIDPIVQWERYAVLEGEGWLGPMGENEDEAMSLYLEDSLGWRYQYEIEQDKCWARALERGGRIIKVGVLELEQTKEKTS